MFDHLNLGNLILLNLGKGRGKMMRNNLVGPKQLVLTIVFKKTENLHGGPEICLIILKPK